MTYKIKLSNIFDREDGAPPPAHRTMNRLAAESVRNDGAGFKFEKNNAHVHSLAPLAGSLLWSASGCAERVYG